MEMNPQPTEVAKSDKVLFMRNLLVNHRRFLIGTLIVVIVAGVVWMQMSDPLKREIPGGDVQSSSDVKWQSPELLKEENYFPKMSENPSDIPLAEKHYKVGTFTRGPFSGADFILVIRTGDGMGGENIYRFAKTSNALTLLQLNSDAFWSDPQSPKSSFAVNDSYVVDELVPPKILRSPDGVFTITKTNVGFMMQVPMWSEYQKQKIHELFKDSVYGAVYISDALLQPTPTPLADTYAPPVDNGFHLKLADETMVTYGPVFEFMDESFPVITWTDGISSGGEYTWQDHGGCGFYTIQSIVPQYVVNPSVDLVRVGTTQRGDGIYGLKDPGHSILKKIYDTEYYAYSYDGSPVEKMSYDDFLKRRPAFFWIDQLDRVIKFQSKEFIPPGECGKPVIYLYPPKATNVDVQVSPRGGMSKSEPAYGTGWHVLAQPNGQLTNSDGTHWPYLFWEGNGDMYQQSQAGWSIAKDDVSRFLEETLAKLGLQGREISDFKEFWLPRMQDAPYYFISFVGNRAMDSLAPLAVYPQPDTIIRVLMDFTPLTQPVHVQAPTIQTPLRSGFTVVEWGGVIR